MSERELFGEMACKNRQSRAATVQAARPCYVLELLSNVLDTLEKDPWLADKFRRTYQDRVLEIHLRGFSLLRHLPEDMFASIFSRVRSRLSLVYAKKEEVIFKERDASDALYLIRQGWVQVKVREGAQDRVIAYRGRGEFIGEMGLIRTEEQVAALKKADFTGVLQAMPDPGPRTATCVAVGHPDGTAQVELLRIPYEDFWELIKTSPGIRGELVAEVERRRKKTPLRLLLPEVKGQENELFGEPVFHHGFYQGQSLMLIDLDRCTRCDECVHACVDTHQDGRSRLFLAGPRVELGGRTFLAPTTCQSCMDPVCMIGCPTRAIQRGDGGQITISADRCIGCGICAGNCPYNAIQMHDLGIIPGLKPAPNYLTVRGADKTASIPPSHGWYCLPKAEIGASEAWCARTSPPRGWLACTLPLAFDRDFREGLAAAARRPGGSREISPDETLCFWRTFSTPLKRGNWDELQLEVESAPESLKVWIDGEPIVLKPGARKYAYRLPVPTSNGWRWWRREHSHVLALQVIPKCAAGAMFLDVRLDAVLPPRGRWDILEEFIEKKKPNVAVVCDLCHTLAGGPACIRACPHNATIRFDARGGVPQW